MKTLEWKGPEMTRREKSLADAAWLHQMQGFVPKRTEESLSDSMDRLHHEKHAKFRRWQDACVMNMIFGDNYVTVPEIPKGYEDYAKWWFDNELKSIR